MNTISIVLLALSGALSAIQLAEKFVTNQSVLKVLQTVEQAITVAESLLGGLHTELAKGVADGKIDVADPDLGGLEVKKSK